MVRQQEVCRRVDEWGGVTGWRPLCGVLDPKLVIASGTGRRAVAVRPKDDAFDIVDTVLVERVEYEKGPDESPDQKRRTAMTGDGFRLASGRSVEVAHPEFAALSPGGRTVAVFQQDSEGAAIIDLGRGNH